MVRPDSGRHTPFAQLTSDSKFENAGLNTRTTVRATVDPSNLSPRGLYIMIYDFKRLVHFFLNRHK